MVLTASGLLTSSLTIIHFSSICGEQRSWMRNSVLWSVLIHYFHKRGICVIKQSSPFLCLILYSHYLRKQPILGFLLKTFVIQHRSPTLHQQIVTHFFPYPGSHSWDKICEEKRNHGRCWHALEQVTCAGF